jgi:ribonuclease HII
MGLVYRPELFAGVDEVGRGPLAGAVVAAAVVLDPFRPMPGLKDSKRLSAKRRAELDLEIREHAIGFAIGRAEPREIDQLNILWASMRAMERAIEGLDMSLDHVMVDGNRIPDVPFPTDFLIKGDDRVGAIMAASILAKVARDKEMSQLDEQYPKYELALNKGYATEAHLAALQKYGPSPVHRLSFEPCRQRRLPF